MKKLLALVLVSMLISSPSLAYVGVEADGVRKGIATNINFVGGPTITGGSTKAVSYAAPAITGGTIDGAVIGGTTPAAGTFTNLTVNGNTTIGDAAADTLLVNANTISFEGATADAFEAIFAFTDPTADNTFTFADGGGTVMVSSLATNATDAANSVTGASNAIVFEGATADAFELTLAPADATADATITLPDGPGTVMLSSLATNAVDAANSITGASNNLVFEGATADGFETLITPTDATADRTLTLPDAGGTVMLSSLATNGADAANAVTGASNALVFEGATADGFETSLVSTDVGADATITLPAQTGTVHVGAAATALTADTTATITVTAGNQLFTYTIDTDNEDCTLTFSAGGAAGDEVTIIFITDSGGSADEVMTFDSTLADSEGTLTLANATAQRYVIRFISDGTIWNEVSRTAILA